MLNRYAVLAFVTTVTCYLLGRVLVAAATGFEGFAEVAVYGVAAAFGLEFLIDSWGSLWRAPLR